MITTKSIDQKTKENQSDRYSQQGQVTLDFLFGSVLILTVSALLMVLTMALTFSEVMQYISFSAARSYFAADNTEQDQVAAAKLKADYLLSDNAIPFLKGALANGWITISGGRAGNGRAKNYKTYADNLGVSSQVLQTQGVNQFVGYQIKFEIPILGMKLPLLASTISPPEGSKGFEATVSSFLMREPTRAECENYTNKAFEILLQKNTGFRKANFKGFRAINDNGC